MNKILEVYLHQQKVGELSNHQDGNMVFNYAETWLANPNAMPLSCSLPLRSESYNARVCRGFFAGILPEENKRKIIARNLGISTQNDFALLSEIGGECAGAVTFVPKGDPLPSINDHYRRLEPSELADILRLLPRRPLMAGEQDVRLSLAGAQDKIAVHIVQNQISIPLGNAPSTHILKPAITEFAGLVFNP